MRQFVTAAGRRYPLKTEAERRASKRQRGTSAASGAPIRIPHPPISAATPRGYARYARGNRVPAALLLFALVAGIRALRRGQLPTARETVGLLVAALVIAVAASFVPEVVIAFLLALAFVVAIDETDRIVAATRWLESLLSNTPRESGLSTRGL